MEILEDKNYIIIYVCVYVYVYIISRYKEYCSVLWNNIHLYIIYNTIFSTLLSYSYFFQ